MLEWGLGVARARAVSFLLPMLGSLLGYEWAREHLARIIELAPQDTSIHKAAREQIAMLK